MRNNVGHAVLRVFLRLAETRSFSDTARLEGLSQPALSRAIRALEDKLGVRLFDRTTRSVALTASGEQLAAVAARLIYDYDAALDDLALAFAGLRGRIAVGALPSIGAVVVPPVLARFHSTHPAVEVRLWEGLSSHLLQRLEAREIDIAVTTGPVASRRFTFTPLFTDECVLVCSHDDPFAGREIVQWRELEGRRFIAMAPESSVRHLTDIALRQQEAEVTPLYECTQLATVGALVRCGLGVSALPSTTLPLVGQAGLTSCKLFPVVNRIIGVAQLASRSLAPAAQAFVACLSEHSRPGGRD